jgi:hypothetical protein
MILFITPAVKTSNPTTEIDAYITGCKLVSTRFRDFVAVTLNTSTGDVPGLAGFPPT